MWDIFDFRRFLELNEFSDCFFDWAANLFVRS